MACGSDLFFGASYVGNSSQWGPLPWHLSFRKGNCWCIAGLLVISHLASTLHRRASDVDMMHNCRYCFWGAIATQSLVLFPNTRSTTYTSGLPEFRPHLISGMKTTLYNLKPTFNPRICVWTPPTPSHQRIRWHHRNCTDSWGSAPIFSHLLAYLW